MDYSPFSKLSAEIRNRIWGSVLVSSQGVDVLMDDIPHAERPPHLQNPEIVAITLTCRQIQHEALPIFLRNKIRIRAEKAIGSMDLKFMSLNFVADEISVWYESWGVYAVNLQNVEICLGDMYEYDGKREIAALRIRYKLVRELRKLFEYGSIPLPYVTIKLDLYSPMLFDTPEWTCQHRLDPIKIDLGGRSSVQENGDAITRAIAGVRKHVDEYCLATAWWHDRYWNYLQDKELRARNVLDMYVHGLMPDGFKI